MGGAKKMKALTSSGEKIFTFHGRLGKVIIAIADLNLLVAVWVMNWGLATALQVSIPVVLCGIFGTVWPKADEQMDCREEVASQDSDSAETIGMVGVMERP